METCLESRQSQSESLVTQQRQNVLYSKVYVFETLPPIQVRRCALQCHKSKFVYPMGDKGRSLKSRRGRRERGRGRVGHCAACSTGQLWIYDGRCRAGWHAPWPWQTSRARILKHCILTSHLPHLQTWSKWEKEKIADMGSASSDFLSMLVVCKALSALLVGPFPSLSVSAPCPHSCFIEDVIWLKIGFLPCRLYGGAAAESTGHSPFYSIRIIVLPHSRRPPSYSMLYCRQTALPRLLEYGLGIVSAPLLLLEVDFVTALIYCWSGYLVGLRQDRTIFRQPLAGCESV